ncbi:MAG: hypothetical protein ACR2NQ_02725 [Thermodesulfobacteriota bacterium]
MSSGSGRGFFSSLFGSVKEQSADVYGSNAPGVLFFFVVFALAAVVIPVAALAGIALYKMLIVQ